MVYIVERYVPGLARSDLLRGLIELTKASEGEDAATARYLGSTIVLADESCFCHFEAPSVAAVAEANHRAGLPFDRIAIALTITTRSGVTR